MLEEIKKMNGFKNHSDNEKILSLEFETKSSAKKAVAKIEELNAESQEFIKLTLKERKIFCKKDVKYEIDPSQLDRTFIDSDYTKYVGFIEETVSKSGELLLTFDSIETAKRSLKDLSAIGFNPQINNNIVTC